ncbi:helix-turn-helix domain-containing protein [Corynebacterium flavescens]|uniref:HTH cro/C1-type domain-containing protein n=1 Tax=Corynebacterium flavescens TaxID=28028 RepID=A0A1L7CNK4_CORFL|nr:helix-turn-helix transcriptional regulator [Corynebacterium flavescens]APT87420.1 hypothetical protein CFLV_09705 [Corynebacterium flavescens]KAA8720509.1 helix-turn-helix domain-containing protein [Corynebacterium flavescens]
MTTTQWRAGQLLQAARERQGLSKAEAARRSGLSESWWRRLETGVNIRNGQKIPVKATPEALTKAAHGVNLAAIEVLIAAGMREPAADTPGQRAAAHDLIDSTPEERLPEAVAFLRGLNATR